MRKFVLLVAMGCFLLSPLAAQVEKGDSEISVSFSFESTFQMTSVMGYSSTVQIIRLTTLFGYGQFINQNSELGANLTMIANTQKSLDAADAEWGGSGTIFVGPFYTYHFIGQDPRLLPFVGVTLGKSFDMSGEEDAPSMWGYGFYGGLKYFISEKTIIGPQLQYRKQSVSIDAAGEEITGSLSSIIAMVSMGYIF